MDITESKKNEENLRKVQNELESHIEKQTTEISEANDALRDREEKYRLLFNNCNDSIFVHQPKVEGKNGTFIEVNDIACQMYGYSKEELLALSPTDLMAPDQKENIETFIKDTLSEGRNVFEVIHKTEDGRQFPTEISSYLFDYQEHPTILSIARDITVRKRVETALIESERKWRNILTKTPQVGISLNPEAEIVFANEHFLSLTGWSGHEVIGRNWFDMFIPEPAREEIRGVFGAIFEKKDASEFTGYENEILTRNGELRTIAWSNVLTKDARGEILDVTCLGIEVSERQRYEKGLKESELKYRQLTETMLETLSVVDLNGVFLYANRIAAHNLSGGKSDDITGKNIRQLLPEDQAEQLIGQYKEVYSSNEPYSQEILVHLKKGDTWFSNTLKPIDFGPSQIPAVLSVSLDITERKNAEAALYESETKYRVLFNTFPLGITISDESGNIVEANDMSSELLGIPKDDHQERRIDGPEWRIIRPDGSDMPPEEWASVRALKEHRLCENAEMGIVQPDGETTWINVTAAPLHLEKYGVVVAYGDITDHKQADQNYQMLFREMIDGFALHEIICDKDGQPENYKFLAVNPAFEKMTGLKADKIVGQECIGCDSGFRAILD